MHLLKIFSFMALVLAIAIASPKHGKNKDNMNSLKSINWLSASEFDVISGCASERLRSCRRQLHTYMKQYENNDGSDKRVATEFGLKCDYILKMNENSHFGKSAAAQKYGTYHGQHQS